MEVPRVRAWLNVSLALACLCGLSGCNKATPQERGAGILVGVCDPLCRETASACVVRSAKRDYRGLVRAVRDRTGIELRLRYFRFDDQLAAAVAAGDVDAAIGKTWTILKAAAAADSDWRRLADLPRSDGVNELTGVFITRADSDLSAIEDIAGKVLGMGPDTAYEKSFQVRRTLEAAGVVPGSTSVLDGCVPTGAAVYEKEVAAGVVSNYVVDFNGLALVSDPKDFKVIGKTEPIPFITFALSAAADARFGRQLREALLEMTGDKVSKGLETTGFVVPTDWRPPELERK